MLLIVLIRIENNPLMAICHKEEPRYIGSSFFFIDDIKIKRYKSHIFQIDIDECFKLDNQETIFYWSD